MTRINLSDENVASNANYAAAAPAAAAYASNNNNNNNSGILESPKPVTASTTVTVNPTEVNPRTPAYRSLLTSDGPPSDRNPPTANPTLGDHLPRDLLQQPAAVVAVVATTPRASAGAAAGGGAGAGAAATGAGAGTVVASANGNDGSSSNGIIVDGLTIFFIIVDGLTIFFGGVLEVFFQILFFAFPYVRKFGAFGYGLLEGLRRRVEAWGLMHLQSIRQRYFGNANGSDNNDNNAN